jgi:glycosyltransferase involved in cell wall biosynthesis
MIAYASYASENRGRLEATALVEMGCEVIFLVLKEGAKPRTYNDGAITVRELNIRKYCGKGPLHYLLSYLMFLCLAFLACTRLSLKDGISAVHVHNMPDFLVFAGLIPRLLGRQVILDVHDSVPETYMAKFGTDSSVLFETLRLEEKICCWFATDIICVNAPQRDVLIDRGIPARKIATILSVPRFSNPKYNREAHRSQERFRLVYHGTISRRLGLDLVINAMAKVIPSVPGLEFHLYGAGDDLEEFLHLAQSLGVRDRIQFHGVIDWSKLPEVLAEMDAGIVANRKNICTDLMLPAKLMDYVSLEIAAIAPRLRTIRYYFTEDMVSYFEPENLDEMVEAILRLYRDQSRRERQATKAKRFLEEHRWENQQRCLRKVYFATEDEPIGNTNDLTVIEKSRQQSNPQQVAP